MGGDQLKPVKGDTTREGESHPKVTAAGAVSDQDMQKFSKRMDELRGVNPNPASAPDVSFYDSAEQAPHVIGSRDFRPNGLRSADGDTRFEALSGDPGQSGRQLYRLKLGRGSDPESRSYEMFQKYESYKAPDGTIRLRPRGEEGPQRPGELPPKLAKELHEMTENMGMHPPTETGKLPSPVEQARLKEQAKVIASMIGEHGDLRAGDKRAKIDEMFQSATKNGEESLNYLVKQVNDQLKATHPDLQLQYKFNTQSAWYSRDTHGADVSYPANEFKENHSTVGLVQNTTDPSHPNLIRSEVKDRIKSIGSMRPPGYIKTEDPHPKFILD